MNFKTIIGLVLILTVVLIWYCVYFNRLSPKKQMDLIPETPPVAPEVITVSLTQEQELKLTTFFETAEQSRVIWRLIRIQYWINVGVKGMSAEKKASVSKLDETWVQLESLQQQNSLCDDGMIVYLKAMHDVYSDQYDEKTVQSLIKDLKSPMVEETLMIADHWMRGKYSEVFYPEIIFPIRCYGFPNPFSLRPTLHLSRLPYQFKALGLHDKAWRSFFEHNMPYEFRADDRDYMVIAVHSYHTADCAYRAGEKRLGRNLLMKAAVFGTEETFEKVKETAALWLYCEENNKPLPPSELFAYPVINNGGYPWIQGNVGQFGMKELEDYLGSIYDWKTKESRSSHIESNTWNNPRLRDAMFRRIGEPGLTEKEIRRECWDFIINAYVKMNAHPRAWALIDEYPQEFENSKELKKKIQDDWLKIISPMIQAVKYKQITSATVYGHRLYPDGIDPLEVTIPWAFPEGSVERAKQELQKVLDELKAKL